MKCVICYKKGFEVKEAEYISRGRSVCEQHFIQPKESELSDGRESVGDSRY